MKEGALNCPFFRFYIRFEKIIHNNSIFLGKYFGAKKIIYIFASSNYNGRGRFHAKLKNITTMKTYKANMQKTLNATANSRTLNIDTTRTFDNENAAVEQGERELEANGWSIKKVDGGGITMSKLNNHNIPQSCKLFIS